MPLKECDLVMKGGISSGVVYPQAILELAKVYRFRCIGGASAGAIAAAFAAAAELGRETGGFERLEKVAEELARPNFLLGLFQPEPKLENTYELLFKALTQPTTGGKVWGLIKPLILHPLPIGLGVALAASTGWMLTPLAESGRVAVLVLFAVLSLVMGIAVGAGFVAIGKFRQGAKEFQANDFGFVHGFRGSKKRQSTPNLTEWLAYQLDFLSGRVIGQYADYENEKSTPITFGDIESGGKIKLNLIVSNLSQGQAYSWPFREGDRFIFSEVEFRKLFPRRVVDQLVAKAPDEPLPTGYHFLPSSDDLPVVVAVRISLSFPVLFGAVPLYTLTAEGFRCLNKQPETLDAATHLQRNLFSDGGLSSNFPIGLFDSWLPTRPTFGINLTTAERVQDTPAKQVWIPAVNRPFPPEFRPISGFMGFANALFMTSKDHRNNTDMRLPGVRSRVVNIGLASGEGGLNLNMSPETIKKMGEYGQLAGLALVNDFNWEQHRWIRARVLIPRLKEGLESVALATGPAGWLTSAIPSPAADWAYVSQVSGNWKSTLQANFEALHPVAIQWQNSPVIDTVGAPKPTGKMRITSEF